VVPNIPNGQPSPIKEASVESIVHAYEDTSPSEETPRSLKVYEDPFTEGQGSASKPVFAPQVLEDKPVNETVANVNRTHDAEDSDNGKPAMSPEKVKQNTRLLDSGINKVKAKSLDVHGFRKLQSIIRDGKAPFTDDRFDSMLLGLFEFLQSPMTNLAQDKVQDTRAQILATIKLLLKKMRDSFQPHVSRGLEALLATRAAYDARTHIVAGLESLADELVTLGDASEIALVLTRMLQQMDMDATGCRSLSMGLSVLREMVEARPAFAPSDAELAMLAGLTERCLDSTEVGVRMDAVQLCVALHARVGDPRFWDVMRGVKDDPKSVITYYIVKRQREKA
jgi:CLIP-associating protein 1/2